MAKEMLEGELTYRRCEHDPALAHLRAAIALKDNLPYDEPWGWMQPVCHALGVLLLEQDRTAEADAVYREDLGLGGALPRAQIHPDNEPLLGTSDIQSLADLSNNFSILRRILPAATSDFIGLVLPGLIPALPLVATVMPLGEVLTDLLKLIA